MCLYLFKVDSTGSFNTLVDIKLKHWAEKELANKSVQVLQLSILDLIIFDKFQHDMIINLCVFLGRLGNAFPDIPSPSGGKRRFRIAAERQQSVQPQSTPLRRRGTFAESAEICSGGGGVGTAQMGPEGIGLFGKIRDL